MKSVGERQNSVLPLKGNLAKKVASSLERFLVWLDNFGETSHDYQSFYAGPLGRKAKSLYYKNSLFGSAAVAPIVFLEAFFPASRKWFWDKQRFPIADAHYAMGFGYLSRIYGERGFYEKALHFLDALCATRSPGYRNFCWGYPFIWTTKVGSIAEGTPLITSTPYAYEAFSQIHEIDGNGKWLEIMRSIAEHAANDIHDQEMEGDASTCAYRPDGGYGVVNASAYRAFLLTSASIRFSEERYRRIAEKNVHFVLRTQKPDGSWPYSIDEDRDFIDHFHTCFVLKALAKIESLTGHAGCREAIERGVSYYLDFLFDEENLPKPFSRAPRLTIYRKELYDYAECINLCVLLRTRFERLDRVLTSVLEDLLSRWQKPDGSFRSRKLIVGWDDVPMHRWAQSQLFRSLAFYLDQENQKVQ